MPVKPGLLPLRTTGSGSMQRELAAQEEPPAQSQAGQCVHPIGGAASFARERVWGISLRCEGEVAEEGGGPEVWIYGNGAEIGAGCHCRSNTEVKP